MICPPCKVGGLALRRGEPAANVEFNHRHCSDPLKCPCQHEIAPVEQIVSRKKER